VEEREQRLERVLVRLPVRGQEQDLGVDLLERAFEIVYVADTDDAFEVRSSRLLPCRDVRNDDDRVRAVRARLARAPEMEQRKLRGNADGGGAATRHEDVRTLPLGGAGRLGAGHLDENRDAVTLRDRLAQPAHGGDRSRPRQPEPRVYRLRPSMRIAAAALVVVLVVAGAAQAARIAGTAGSDRLVGTARADTISGRDGRDVLLGLSGTDFLEGGAARDRIDSGPGNDRVAVEYDGSRDTVRCGAGTDTVTADLTDDVEPDCELVGRRLSRDPYTGPEAQHESEVEPDSLTVGRTTVSTFQVGRRHSGAADNVGWATSTDGGLTWRSGLLPGLTRVSAPAGPHERASDPVVAYDAAHGAWLISTLALEGQATRLPVSRSSDGITWASPVIAAEGLTSQGIAIDKNWIACDNGTSSPFRGRCYIVYTDALRDDRLAVVSSDDGGLTWSSPVGIPVTSAVGAFPVIRQDGGLVIAYLWFGRRIGASVSTDGGRSFGSPVVVAEVERRSIRGLRFFPLPSADVDPSGRVWVTWDDCRFSPGCAANSVVVATSTDGRSWTPPARVTAGRDAFLPAIGAHPTNGRLAAAYHVVRPGGGIDVELVEFRAGAGGRPVGASAPRRLSARTIRPEWSPSTTSGRMLADYISVHYAGTRPLVLWVLASPPVGTELRQAVYATRG
jgi:hypothetical protein